MVSGELHRLHRCLSISVAANLTTNGDGTGSHTSVRHMLGKPINCCERTTE